MTQPEVQPGPSDDELVRLLLRVLAGVVALVLALGVATAAARLTDRHAGDVPAAASQPAYALFGPPPGRLVAPYLQARTRELAGARGARSAVVSFGRYLDQPDASRPLASTGVRVHVLLVAAPGGSPAEVPPAGGSVAEYARRQRSEALAEKRALEQLLPTVKDPDFVRQYSEDVARLTSLARWLERPGPLVYGAVVTGSADQLAGLARRPEVRLVDAAAGDQVPPSGQARGLRPEETVTVGEPAARPPLP